MEVGSNGSPYKDNTEFERKKPEEEGQNPQTQTAVADKNSKQNSSQSKNLQNHKGESAQARAQLNTRPGTTHGPKSPETANENSQDQPTLIPLNEAEEQKSSEEINQELESKLERQLEENGKQINENQNNHKLFGGRANPHLSAAFAGGGARDTVSEATREQAIEQRKTMIAVKQAAEQLKTAGKIEEANQLMHNYGLGLIASAQSVQAYKPKGPSSSIEKPEGEHEIIGARKAYANSILNQKEKLESYNKDIDALDKELKENQYLSDEDRENLLDSRLKLELERDELGRITLEDAQRYDKITEAINEGDYAKATELLAQDREQVSNQAHLELDSHSKYVLSKPESHLNMGIVTRLDVSSRSQKSMSYEAKQAQDYQLSQSTHDKLDIQEHLVESGQGAVNLSFKTIEDAKADIKSEAKELDRLKEKRHSIDFSIKSGQSKRNDLEREIRAQEKKIVEAEAKLEKTVKASREKQKDQIAEQRKLDDAKALLREANTADKLGESAEAQKLRVSAAKVLEGHKQRITQGIGIQFEIEKSEKTGDASNHSDKGAETEALEYRDGLNQFTHKVQEQLKEHQKQLESIQKQLLNPHLNKEQRVQLSKVEQSYSKAVHIGSQQLDQIQQYQEHVTELVREGKFDEIKALRDGSEIFKTATKSFNNPDLKDKVLKRGLALTKEETIKDYERLTKLSADTVKSLSEFSKMLDKHKATSLKFADEHGPWQGNMITKGGLAYLVYERHIDNQAQADAAISETNASKLDSVSKYLADNQKAADELFKEGKVHEAREKLKEGFEWALREKADTDKNLGKHYEENRGKALELINQNYEAIKTTTITVVAATVTMATAGGAAPLTLALAGEALIAGVSAGAATAYATELANAYGEGHGIDSWEIANSKIGEGLKASALGAAGGLFGLAGGSAIRAGLGKEAVKKLMVEKFSPQFSSAVGLYLQSAGSGAAGAIPGVVDDVYSKSMQRAELKQELKEQGKTDEEIEAELAKNHLDTLSLIKATTASLISGAASGAVGGKSGAASQAAKNKLQKEAIKLAEDIVSTSIGIAETVVVYGADSEQFEQALISNIGGAVISSHAARIQAEHTHSAAKQEMTKIAQKAYKAAKDANAKVEIEVSEDLPNNVEAQTRIEEDPITRKKTAHITLNKEIADGLLNSDPEAVKTYFEELAKHGTEKLIDPREANGTRMPKDKYYARRAQQEIAAKAAAEKAVYGDNPPTKDGNGNDRPDLNKTSEKIVELIQAGVIHEIHGRYEEASKKFDQALKVAEDNGVTAADKQNYAKDYDYNVKRDPSRDPLRQTSNSALTDTRQAPADSQLKIFAEYKDQNDAWDKLTGHDPEKQAAMEEALRIMDGKPDKDGRIPNEAEQKNAQKEWNRLSEPYRQVIDELSNQITESGLPLKLPDIEIKQGDGSKEAQSDKHNYKIIIYTNKDNKIGAQQIQQIKAQTAQLQATYSIAAAMLAYKNGDLDPNDPLVSEMSRALKHGSNRVNEGMFKAVKENNAQHDKALTEAGVRNLKRWLQADHASKKLNRAKTNSETDQALSLRKAREAVENENSDTASSRDMAFNQYMRSLGEEAKAKSTLDRANQEAAKDFTDTQTETLKFDTTKSAQDYETQIAELIKEKADYEAREGQGLKKDEDFPMSQASGAHKRVNKRLEQAKREYIDLLRSTHNPDQPVINTATGLVRERNATRSQSTRDTKIIPGPDQNILGKLKNAGSIEQREAVIQEALNDLAKKHGIPEDLIPKLKLKDKVILEKTEADGTKSRISVDATYSRRNKAISISDTRLQATTKEGSTNSVANTLGHEFKHFLIHLESETLRLQAGTRFDRAKNQVREDFQAGNDPVLKDLEDRGVDIDGDLNNKLYSGQSKRMEEVEQAMTKALKEATNGDHKQNLAENFSQENFQKVYDSLSPETKAQYSPKEIEQYLRSRAQNYNKGTAFERYAMVRKFDENQLKQAEKTAQGLLQSEIANRHTDKQDLQDSQNGLGYYPQEEEVRARYAGNSHALNQYLKKHPELRHTIESRPDHDKPIDKQPKEWLDKISENSSGRNLIRLSTAIRLDALHYQALRAKREAGHNPEANQKFGDLKNEIEQLNKFIESRARDLRHPTTTLPDTVLAEPNQVLDSEAPDGLDSIIDDFITTRETNSENKRVPDEQIVLQSESPNSAELARKDPDAYLQDLLKNDSEAWDALTKHHGDKQFLFERSLDRMNDPKLTGKNRADAKADWARRTRPYKTIINEIAKQYEGRDMPQIEVKGTNPEGQLVERGDGKITIYLENGKLTPKHLDALKTKQDRVQKTQVEEEIVEQVDEEIPAKAKAAEDEALKAAKAGDPGLTNQALNEWFIALSNNGRVSPDNVSQATKLEGDLAKLLKQKARDEANRKSNTADAMDTRIKLEEKARDYAKLFGDAPQSPPKPEPSPYRPEQNITETRTAVEQPGQRIDEVDTRLNPDEIDAEIKGYDKYIEIVKTEIDDALAKLEKNPKNEKDIDHLDSELSGAVNHTDILLDNVDPNNQSAIDAFTEAKAKLEQLQSLVNKAIKHQDNGRDREFRATLVEINRLSQGLN